MNSILKRIDKISLVQVRTTEREITRVTLAWILSKIPAISIQIWIMNSAGRMSSQMSPLPQMQDKTKTYLQIQVGSADQFTLTLRAIPN